MAVTPGFDVVTGALGYTGRYIARALLARGRRVVTLTGHPDRPNPFGDRLRVEPLDFEHPAALAAKMAGADSLYNTYWIRFDRGPTTFAGTIENTTVLVRAAAAAGVRRIVHISVTNPSRASPLPYYRGKAEVEDVIAGSGLSYAVVRPTVVFGRGDVLINNIAWLLRRIPVFAVPGRGDYRLQPVFVEDLARIALDAAARSDPLVIAAAGPEVFAFDELVRLIARAVGSRARIVHVRPWLARATARLIGWAVHDVLMTRDEVAGLMANLLVSTQRPTGSTRFTDWLAAHGDELGRAYASELVRHFRRTT